jgi:hypothetical protein
MGLVIVYQFLFYFFDCCHKTSDFTFSLSPSSQ